MIWAQTNLSIVLMPERFPEHALHGLYSVVPVSLGDPGASDWRSRLDVLCRPETFQLFTSVFHDLETPVEAITLNSW